MRIVGKRRLACQSARGALAAGSSMVVAATLAGLLIATAGIGLMSSTSSADEPGSLRLAPCTSAQVGEDSQVCVAPGDSRRGTAVVAVIKAEQEKLSQKAVLFGVWDHGKPVVSGALGTSYPGVPATLSMHARIGNITESMECTLLLQLVDRGKIQLSDPVSKWLPGLPDGSNVTVGMLASSTSGYASFYTDAWVKAFQADPFRAWTPSEMIAIGTSQPMVFAPGTNWQFSDTNFMILGQVLAKAGNAPVQSQIQRMILNPLGLHDTNMTSTSFIPSPVLHGYDPERGDYEDSTFWSVSWATNIGDMTSNLSDLGRWARALGTGQLLSTTSHARQFAPTTAGLGPFTKNVYYGLGAIVSNGWIACNPNVPGYWDALGYSPSTGIAIVVIATASADSPQNVHYAVADFNQVAQLLDPSSPPKLPTTG